MSRRGFAEAGSAWRLAECMGMGTASAADGYKCAKKKKNNEFMTADMHREYLSFES